MGLREVGLLDEHRVRYLTSLAFYVALPVLIIASTHDQSLAELVSVKLVVGIWLVLLATAALAWILHRQRASSGERSVAVVQSYHTNVGFLGLPLVDGLYGAEITAVASIVLGLVSVTQSPMTVLLLIRMNGGDTSVRREVKRVGTNPVIVSLALGLTLSTLDVGLSSTIVSGLDALADLALPLALICIGGSLPVHDLSPNVNATGWVTVVKLCCMPVLAWLVFLGIGAAPTSFVAGVVMLGMPTAVSTYVYADTLGGNSQLAAMNVLATVTGIVVTLPVLVLMVSGTP